MSFEQTVLLSAIAGATIFLGLPVGRLRNLSTADAGAPDDRRRRGDPVPDLGHPRPGGRAGRDVARRGQPRRGPAGDFVVDVAAFGLSIGFGLLSLVWFASRVRRRRAEGLSTHDIAVGTAVGLGLHNLSEGLAIGQSAATGATAFALILVIGFALHNATEGFGIAAPLTTGERPTWAFLGASGSWAAGRRSSAA